MRKSDLIVAIVVIVLLSGLVYWLKKPNKKVTLVPTPTPTVQETIEKKFNLNIPEGVAKTELKDVSGRGGAGIATQKYEAGIFTLTILADLADPEKGKFYQGWLVKGKLGDADYLLLSLGKMKVSKGGWILEFQSSKNYSDYKNVVVSLEKTLDSKKEQHLLEGNF